MPDEQQKEPGPGWWLASDGQLYPPEQHPDALRPPLGGSPTPPPTSDAAAGRSPRGRSRSAWLGAFAAVAVIVVIAASIVFGGWVTNRVPSPSSDQTRIEEALPSPSDLPPGLVDTSDSDSASDDDEEEDPCEFFGEMFPTRASAEVEYKRPESLDRGGIFGDGGMAARANSLDSTEMATNAFDALTGPLLTTCYELSDFDLKLSETTGGIEAADQTRVLALEGGAVTAHITVARTGRFVVLVDADSADYSLEWAEKIIEELR